MPDDIRILGAREHNLKNIDVRIPRNQLTVITGLSGSGKSSLAFDTLYAEGQRRYVESLSAYARQFLDQMQKPDVEHIEGLSPAIAIEQRNAGSNPRSIVATTTEIHDYLRLLFANIGKPHCPHCGRPVERQSAEQIVELLTRLPAGTKIILLAPVVASQKGRHEETFAMLRKQGFVRARVNNEMVELDTPPSLDKNKRHTIEAVTDRLVINDSIRSRLTDSVEQTLKAGASLMRVLQTTPDAATTETLYSEKNACAHCNVSFDELKPRNFSFNAPYGACPDCAGLGSQFVFDEDLVVPDKTQPLETAIAAWRRGGHRMILYNKYLLRAIAKQYDVPLKTPYEKIPAHFHQILMHGTGDEKLKLPWRKHDKPFEGVLANLARIQHETESDEMRERLRAYTSKQRCATCNGARLKPEVRACWVHGKSIVDVCAMNVRVALDFFKSLTLTPQQEKIASEVLKEIRRRLTFLADVGLDYLSLDRESASLSGGEMQRIRLATQIGSGLVGVMYVLDEPTIGLHPRDNQRLIATLRQLQQRGNTVIIVEHDEEMMREADWIIDLGPAAGRHGGQLMHQGPFAELMKNTKSQTADYLNGRKQIPIPAKRVAPGKNFLTITGAAENNLKNITVQFPLGCFVCVTGVSGSGKSTLIDDILRKHLARHFYDSSEKPGAFKKITGLEALDKMIEIDQSPIGRTPRSNPATYTGAFTPIRDLFASTQSAKIRGYQPGRFSFNVKGGRCESCKGDGMIRLEMHFLPDVYVPCEQCAGKRYNRETLEVKYRDHSIADVLSLTIDDALEIFNAVPSISTKLATLAQVGLGYLQLGQSSTTLSGGEAQRIKLAAELSKRATGKTLYLLDEPTTGLHFADVHKLLDVLLRLRDSGNTVIVIEHNLDVIKSADWIIDLGPGGGEHGGSVVAFGTPEDVAANPNSITGQFLKMIL